MKKSSGNNRRNNNRRNDQGNARGNNRRDEHKNDHGDRRSHSRSDDRGNKGDAFRGDDRSKERGQDRGGYRNKDRDRDRGEYKSKDRNKERGGYRNKDRDRDRGEYKSKDRNRDQGGYRNKDRDRDQGEYKSKDRSREQGGYRNKDRDRDRGEYKSKDRNRDQGGYRNKDRDRDRGEYKSKDFNKEQGAYGNQDRSGSKDDRPRSGRNFGNRGNRFGGKRDFKKSNRNNRFKKNERYDFDPKNTPVPQSNSSTAPVEVPMRLNKYLSNAGICSRREADQFIEAGVVSVNGKVITQLGFKIQPGDKVLFGGAGVKKEKTVYVLLNKPKGYITTCDDPQERQTVLDLIPHVKERVYPVGRLDRNTSGLLLLTNDGELAKTLMHPKYNVAKIYHVFLDKPLNAPDLDSIRKGVELEDGFIKPDDIAWVEGAESKKEVGIEIHSGRNRIVRRLFEHFGYEVEKLDRVVYAGLTKKNLPRGKWRFLDEKEVRFLKQIK